MIKARVIEKITALQFAMWSFERDRSLGLWDSSPKITKWEHLCKVDKDIYLAEAKEYLKKPLSEWPIDILEKL